MKRALSVLILLLVTFCALFYGLNTNTVGASDETIFIRANGSIDPPASAISSLDNVTYVFSDDINASIVVERSNVVVDGNGFRLQGSGMGYGFSLYATYNVTIRNTNIEGFFIGVWIQTARCNVISGNNITNNVESGIFLQWFAHNNSFSGNRISGNMFGIYMHDSANNTVIGNNITANTIGVQLEVTARGNIVTGNYIASNTDRGVFIYYTSYGNSIRGNNITANTRGIEVEYYSRDNSICGNTIMNSIWGIYLIDHARDNPVHHNNLLNNTNHVRIYDSTGIWDDGFEGNYWSNYNGVDLDHDGIGDTSHVIAENDADNFPLMGLFNSFNTSLGKNVNAVSNCTIDSFEYLEANSTIRMHVSNMTSNQTHGFVRMSVPHEIISEPFNVTIDGANPTYWNYTLYENGTHKWIYFEYEHSTKKIIITTEFPSFLIIPLFMATTLLAAIIYRRKHTALNESLN